MKKMLTEKKKLKIHKKNGVIVSVQTYEYFFSPLSPNNFCAIKPFVPFKITGSQDVEADIRNALKIIKKRFIHAKCIQNKNAKPNN